MQILPMTLRSGEIRARQDTLLSTEVIKKKERYSFWRPQKYLYFSSHPWLCWGRSLWLLEHEIVSFWISTYFNATRVFPQSSRYYLHSGAAFSESGCCQCCPQTVNNGWGCEGKVMWEWGRSCMVRAVKQGPLWIYPHAHGRTFQIVNLQTTTDKIVFTYISYTSLQG